MLPKKIKTIFALNYIFKIGRWPSKNKNSYEKKRKLCKSNCIFVVEFSFAVSFLIHMKFY